MKNQEKLNFSPSTPMSDLLRSFLPQLHGGVNHRCYSNPEAKNRELLDAIIQQVSNAQMPLNHLSQAVGTCLAIAQQTGELEADVVADVGWGIAFLAELSSALDSVRSDAQSLLDNPPKVSEVAA